MSSNTTNRSQANSNRPNNQRRRKNYSSKQSVPARKSTPPPKLTWWQKFLKAIGLYKEPVKAKSQSASAKQNTQSKTAKKGAKKRAPRKPIPQRIDSARLYVGNLSYDVTESDLVELFKGFGGVKRAEVVYNKRTQRSKGFAFVEMIGVDDAKRASEVLHEQPFMGRNLIVNGARTEEEQKNALEAPVA